MRARRRAVVVTVVMIGAVGCTSEEEKVTRVADAALETCRAADGEEFFELAFHDKTTKRVLQAACEEPVTDVTINNYLASAKMGPYYLAFNNDKALGIWVLAGADWEALEEAQSKRAMEDPGLEDYQEAGRMLERAVEEMPSSGYVRTLRLENMLDVQRKARVRARNKADAGGGAVEVDTTLGVAQPVYEETVAWSKEGGDPAAGPAATLLVADYYKSYLAFLDTARESLGSQDDWLEKSISEAEKEKDEAQAQEYREELERRRAARPEQERIYVERQATLRQNLCRELDGLSATSVEDEALKDRILSAKKSYDCSASAAPAE